MGFNTDKIAHGYLPTYLNIAADIGIAGRVCELGVYSGGSLTMWQTLFPKGLVVGVDYLESCVWPVGTKKVISTQNSIKLPEKLRELSPDGYDLIVDDCSHEGIATRQSWELLWPLVVPNGYYVIEDWFVGLPPWSTENYNGHGDIEMLKTAQSFLNYFPEDPTGRAPELNKDLGSATYIRGMIILQKYP